MRVVRVTEDDSVADGKLAFFLSELQNDVDVRWRCCFDWLFIFTSSLPNKIELKKGTRHVRDVSVKWARQWRHLGRPSAERAERFQPTRCGS